MQKNSNNTMLSVRLPENIERKLDTLKQETSKTKAYHVREALQVYFEELEDKHVALERLAQPSMRWTLAQVESMGEDGLEG